MADDGEYMQCMEVWGGNEPSTRAVKLGGLDAWVYSKPFGGAHVGGDVYYASSCATGRINRLLLADVAGHGDAVAESASALRKLMRRYVNFLDQTKFVRSMNRQFVTMSRKGRFATALVTTFFAPSRVLTICNAGHPPPLHFSAATKVWSILETSRDDDHAPRNIPLGILEMADYEQFDVELEVGDLVLCYTDALVESKDTNGEMFGPAGLLRVADTVEMERGGNIISGEIFISELLAKIARRFDGNLSEDDVTVMLLKPNATKPRIRVRQKVGAFGRFMNALVKSVNPWAERAPFPDMKIPNVVGAIIPPLAKRWRPTRPLRTSRPSRQSIP
jgi:hypothetical protein